MKSGAVGPDVQLVGHPKRVHVDELGPGVGRVDGGGLSPQQRAAAVGGRPSDVDHGWTKNLSIASYLNIHTIYTSGHLSTFSHERSHGQVVKAPRTCKNL